MVPAQDLLGNNGRQAPEHVSPGIDNHCLRLAK
jgi:hypothetical protein